MRACGLGANTQPQVQLIRTDSNVFLFMAEEYSIIYIYIYIYVPQLIYSYVDGYLGCFHVLAIVNRDVVNTGIHMSFSIMIFSGYMPSSGIVGS